MTGDGFLSRWSRLKRDEARRPAAPAEELPSDAQPADALPTRAEAPGQPDPGPMPELPSLDEITAQTDMSVFRHPAVPDSLRQAALRKLWSADPAIRDFISPAVDYAWDWNTPGGVPGNGVLGRVDDVTRMLAQVMDGFDRPEVPPEEAPPVEEVPAQAPQPDMTAQEGNEKPSEDPAALPAASAEPVRPVLVAGPMPAEPAEPRRRRHGGAVPV